MGWQLRKPTLVELLLVIAIVGIIVALLLPGPEWASSGHIRFPVRVIVFDAVHGRPIANARVGIFEAAPLDSSNSLEQEGDKYNPRALVRDENRGATGDDGDVVINYEFTTSANHKRPAPNAHLRRAWVNVEAEGYGSVVVPVRHESQPVATLRTQKELVVSVGMLPME
jgi:hypothetical protein